MHSAFSAVDALFAPKNPVHFNLGTIGRLEGHQLGRHGPSVLPLKPFYGAFVQTNPGLPRPGRDLDAKLLQIPDGMPLALLAATHHGVAYYAIFDFQERAVRTAMQFACRSGRLEIGFVGDEGSPLWSAMHLGPPVVACLKQQLASHKDQRASSRDESWRDKLGLLLLGLPVLLAEADPEAGRCTHHSAVLFRDGR